MSQLSKSLMASMGIRPKLKLGRKTAKGVVSTGPHTVVFKADKVITGKDRNGQDCEYVRYLFDENGEEKIYQTKKLGNDGSLSYFVQHFADIEIGDKIILEMKKSGPKNYIDISPVSAGKEVEMSDEEIEDSETAEVNIE